MTATYQREAFADFFDAALPLLPEHKREIAHFQDIELKVDVDRYLVAEAAGVLRVYTVRVQDEVEGLKLVGYAAFFVARNPHYADSLQAVQDVIYVDTRHRRGRLGLGLIAFAESELRAEGVQVVRQHVKLAHPKLGWILQHKFGYEPEETIYVKRLDEAPHG
jgi:hypothetical protein